MAVAVLSVVPATSQAATVRVVTEPSPGWFAVGVEYRSAPGEVNRLVLSTVDDATVRVVDRGATIVPGAGCVSADPHAAMCSAAGPNAQLGGATVHVGDRDDVVSDRGWRLDAVMHGGPGDDRLSGGTGGDVMTGGPGDDRLAGGGGPDRLLGGPGNDDLLGGRAMDDLRGGRGRDALRGGPGWDSLRSGRTARCGRGQDYVKVSAGDWLHRSCETAWFSLRAPTFSMTPYPVERSPRSLMFFAACPYYPRPVTGTTMLSAAGRVIGRARIPARARRRCDIPGVGHTDKVETFTLPVTLNRHGRRLLSDGRPTLVTVAFSGRNVPSAPFSITLG